MQEGTMMCIPIAARLNVPLSELKAALKSYPFLEQLSCGSELVYLTVGNGTTHIFHFGREHILQKVYSTSSPVYSMRESLLRLLGMVSFLGDAYSLSPQSLFPYLLHELSKPELAQLPKSTAQDRNGNPELILSKRIVQLLAELEGVSREKLDLSSKNLRLIVHLLIKESERGSVIIKEFCGRYEFPQSKISLIEKELGHLGIRMLLLHEGRINLVKS